MPKGPEPLPPVATADRDGPETRRLDQLGTLVDHCTAAQAIADAHGDKFLSYMLAMTIQAARAAMWPRR